MFVIIFPRKNYYSPNKNQLSVGKINETSLIKCFAV